MKLYIFRTIPLSIIRRSSLCTQQWFISFHPDPALKLSQTCTTYTIAVCTVKNSWWWTKELSETCNSFIPKYIWEISASSWFYYNEETRECSLCNDVRKSSHVC